MVNQAQSAQENSISRALEDSNVKTIIEQVNDFEFIMEASMERSSSMFSKAITEIGNSISAIISYLIRVLQGFPGAYVEYPSSVSNELTAMEVAILNDSLLTNHYTQQRLNWLYRRYRGPDLNKLFNKLYIYRQKQEPEKTFSFHPQQLLNIHVFLKEIGSDRLSYQVPHYDTNYGFFFLLNTGHGKAIRLQTYADRMIETDFIQLPTSMLNRIYDALILALSEELKEKFDVDYFSWLQTVEQFLNTIVNKHVYPKSTSESGVTNH